MCMWDPFWATKASLIALQWRVWLQQQKLMKIIGDELTAVDNFGVMEFQGYKLVLLKVLYGGFF